MAGTEIGGWFASAVINKLAGFTKSYMENNWELHDQTKLMMDRLATNLVMMKAVMEKLEALRSGGLSCGDDLLAAGWLRQLIDVVYEADDLLDDLEFAAVRGEKKGNNPVSDFLSHAVKIFNNLAVSPPIIKTLKIVLEKSDKLATINPNNLLPNSTEGEQNVSSETSPLTADDILLFGRDHNIRVLKEMTDGSGSGLAVIPILGAGGVGKTALARQIYRHVDTTIGNLLSLWVCVSKNDDMKSIATQMLKSLMVPENILNRMTTLQAIQGFIRNYLKNKRFFVVLDNLWDEMGTIWEDLRPSLTSGARGSVVLVTTQSRITAERMRTTELISLNCLDENDFQSLFEYYAFGDRKSFIDATKLDELQSIGRRIASKLHGLPLAGKILGGLLQSNLNTAYWEKVLGSEWSEILESILPSLGLRFQYLSPNLKQCFAYCSLFPKGYIIKKDKLVQMWMAQGYIQPDKRMRKRLEDIGVELFDELIDKSFFQRTREDQYELDVLMRELAALVSFHECFVVEDDSKGVPVATRHLSSSNDGLNVLDSNMTKLEGLRTIMFFGDYDLEELAKTLTSLFEKSRSLRVLDLSCKRIEVRTIPDSINYLSHLRCLDLSCNKFEQLPKKFDGLFHLQVLNIQRCQFDKVPEGINKLQKLRHLYADVDTLSLITGIGRLTCLQELIEFRIKSVEGHYLTELKDMSELQGSLRITNLRRVPSMEHAKMAMLKYKKHIHSLQLIWDSSEAGKETEKREQETSKAVLEALEPHHSMKELLISKYNGVTSPTWLVNCRDLQSLTLDSCGSWEILPTLGQLRKLKVLHIKHMGSIKLIDDQLYGKHGCGDRKVIFPSLEELILECMHTCEEWLDAEEGFLLLPCLRKLHLISCTKLKSIPLSIFEKLIVDLVIRGCNVLGTAPPQCVRNLKSLRLLEISMYKYESCLDLRSLEALEQLRLNDCRKLTLVDGLDSLAHLTSLKLLQIRNCPAVLQDEKNLHAAGHATRSDGLFTHLDVDMKFLIGHGFLANGRFPNLMALEISGVGDNDYKAVTRKPWFHCLKVLHLHALQSLCLDTLPSSIEELALSHCPFIDSLLVNGQLPASLKKLHIFSCPKLKERCQRGVGADWVRIARIPCIRIDDEMVQMLYDGEEIAANFS